MKFKVLLLDIEGTTTSINFVKEELFGYVHQNLANYVSKHWQDPEVQDCVRQLDNLITQNTVNPSLKLSPMESPLKGVSSEEAFVSNVSKVMDADLKLTPVKVFQGLMWRDAYAQGTVKGHLYDDVLRNLEQFANDGVKIFIYSSGSVEAQKLLFSHSTSGDVTKFLSGYFDTTTGLKTESSSYRKISESIGAKPSDILFLTDVTREAKPALDAGLQVMIVKRPGNAPLDVNLSGVRVIETFDEIERR